MEIRLTEKEIKDYTDEIISYNVKQLFEETLNPERSFTIDEFLVRRNVNYLIDIAQKGERLISGDLHDCMQGIDGCHFEGFENRIKSKNRLREKILVDAYKKFGGDFLRATNNIYDTLRYTIILPFENHFDYLDEYLNRLLDLDYKLVRIKNRWKDDFCKGVTVILRDPNDFSFEIQFHTQENYDVKEIYSREPYKLSRNPNAPADLKEKANRLRVFYHSQVTPPEGAFDYQFRRKSNTK